jgi:hypothetical protein
MQTEDVTVMKRRAIIGSVILALLSAGLLVACRGGGNEEATPTAETDAEAADAHAEANARASHSLHVERNAFGVGIRGGPGETVARPPS